MMVGTMQNQNSSLLDATTVSGVVMRDDDDELQKIITDKGTEEVWRSLSPHDNIFHISVQNKALKCLKELLGNSPPQEVFDAPDDEGRTPLIIAVAMAKFEVVEMLINAGANVDARDDTGKSALHIVVSKISSGTEDLQKITTLLLDHPDINLEPHDQDHFTPLEIVAKELLQSDDASKTKSLIMFCEQLENKGVPMTAKIGPRTIKEIIQSKQSLSTVTKDLELNSEPLMRKSSEFIEMIILGKSMEKIQEFLDEEKENGRNATKLKLGSKSLLYYAIGRVNMPLVEILLEAGADPWLPETTNKNLPIYRAAAIGHYEIFNLLIKKMKGKKRTIDLDKHSFRILQKIIENSAKQKEISEDIDYSKCLTRLMEKDVIIDFNQEEDDETILHVAASFSNQEALSKLLQHGAFLGARRRGLSKVYGNILPYLLPETLADAMDGCISYQPSSKSTSKQENILNADYTLKLDYRFLVPPAKKVENKKKKHNEMKTLMEINRSKRHRPVIKHPLIQALLYAKWSKALPFYVINVIIYFFFTILLTFFVYTVKDLRLLEEQVNSASNSAPTNSTADESIDNLQMTANGLKAGLMVFNSYMVIREIVQIVTDRDIYYSNVENCLEWFLVAVIFILCFIPLGVTWTQHLAAWTMIVAWFELVLILGRASPLTIYITMLRRVSWNIAKFTIVYGLLVLAFTFSFSIILQPNEHTDFNDFWSTLPKMIAMGTGEFEYSELSDTFGGKVVFHFIFFTFLIFIFLILMNVMIGLAVADTQEVVEDAKLYSLSTRAELLYLVEVFVLKLYRWMPNMAESLLNRFQLISGTQTSSCKDLSRSFLYIKVNKPEDSWCVCCCKKPERDDSESFIKLNEETTECLRSHHVHHLEEENKKRHGDSMNQEEDKKHCGDMMNKCLRILEEVQQRLQKA